MFQYDMNASMPTILAKSQLRNALMEEWPGLEVIDINTIATEAELVDAIAHCTGRTPREATMVVRDWMERQNLPPVYRTVDPPRDRGSERWEDDGGSIPIPSSRL